MILNTHIFSPAREELKRREGMLRKLKALSSSMLKLADRRKRWTIRWEMVLVLVLVLVLVFGVGKNLKDRSGKVEAEWGDAVQERRRMRVELENLIRSKCLKTCNWCIKFILTTLRRILLLLIV